MVLDEASAAGISPPDVIWALKLLRPMEAHHPATRQHSLRVGVYASRLATMTGLDARLALCGGIVHDIGKLDVPAKVLDAEPFGAEHYADVRRHPTSGFLRLSTYDYDLALIAGLHHAFQSEPYGMDQGLAAPRVLAVARLVAMCDFADALFTRHDEHHNEADRAPVAASKILLSAFPDHADRAAWLAANAIAA